MKDESHQLIYEQKCKYLVPFVNKWSILSKILYLNWHLLIYKARGSLEKNI